MQKGFQLLECHAQCICKVLRKQKVKTPMNLAGIEEKGITEEVSLELDPERSGIFNRQQREEGSF